MFALERADTHQLLNAFQGLSHAHGGEIGDPIGPDPHGQSLWTQTLSSTAGTGHQFQILLQLLTLGLTTGVTELSLKDRQDALKRAVVPRLPLAITAVGLNQDGISTAVEQHVLLLFRQLLPGSLDLETERLTDGIEQGEVIGVVFLSPGRHSGVHRQGRIRNHPLTGELAQMPDAVTGLASTVGAVEGEQPR